MQTMAVLRNFTIEVIANFQLGGEVRECAQNVTCHPGRFAKHAYTGTTPVVVACGQLVFPGDGSMR